MVKRKKIKKTPVARSAPVRKELEVYEFEVNPIRLSTFQPAGGPDTFEWRYQPINGPVVILGFSDRPIPPGMLSARVSISAVMLGRKLGVIRRVYGRFRHGWVSHPVFEAEDGGL